MRVACGGDQFEAREGTREWVIAKSARRRWGHGTLVRDMKGGYIWSTAEHPHEGPITKDESNESHQDLFVGSEGPQGAGQSEDGDGDHLDSDG